jgi:hypothetical protein
MKTATVGKIQKDFARVLKSIWPCEELSQTDGLWLRALRAFKEA